VVAFLIDAYQPVAEGLWLMGHDAAGAGVQRWRHGLVGEDGTCVAVGEECVRVGMDERVLARAAGLIAHDLAATLGWEAGRAGMEARAVLENRAGLLLTGPAWGAWTARGSRSSSTT
jgi:hypothetical protein